ncbi:MAG: hypothetical protein H6729_03025 [Deltaproteobacteria bacterium]|nr:hypothetical protein [Deltaproteobacteria bacterium]
MTWDGGSTSDSIMVIVLRIAGVSLLVLACLHGAFWRTFRWSEAMKCLSPLNARIFITHMVFVIFILVAQGMLLVLRPDLLLTGSDLARLLLYALIAFWLLRFVLQPLVFNPVLQEGWTGSVIVKIGSMLLWLAYAVMFGKALLSQTAR